MEVYRIEDMEGGWYAGDFSPVAYQTSDFEICYKKHFKGEEWPKHYHKEADEINFLRSGKMIIQGRELNSGDVFILRKDEIADPVFLEDCEVFIVKTPSVPGDKFVIE
jgi:mannose-6-phosphate isomerase-like protein (cupin superfamily)